MRPDAKSSHGYKFNPNVPDYDEGRRHSDYGMALDSDLARLRMEVNVQQKSLSEQLNGLKFMARQATQEKDQAKLDLDRLLQDLRERTNRANKYTKPLDKMKQRWDRQRLRSQRGLNDNPLEPRKNLNTYQDIFFNDFKNLNGGHKFQHNDNDPFNISTGKQPNQIDPQYRPQYNTPGPAPNMMYK